MGLNKILIPERFSIFPEFRDIFPGIPGGFQLYQGASKISIDVAEPLTRVYLDIIKEMVTPLHELTPSCTLVAPGPGWGPHPVCAVGLFPPSTSLGAVPLAPYHLDMLCGRPPPTHMLNRGSFRVPPGHTQSTPRNSGICSISSVVLLRASRPRSDVCSSTADHVFRDSTSRKASACQFRDRQSMSCTPLRHVCRGTADTPHLHPFRQGLELAR